MPQIVLSVPGDGLALFADAVEKLGSEKAAHTAFRRAINHTGAKATTQVRRALSKQIGLGPATLKKLGGTFRTDQAWKTLAYTIEAKGKGIPLRHFGARQFAFGVRAKPWGRWQRYPGTFIFAGNYNSGRPVNAGNVFHRRTARSMPIELMFGPAVPVEIVKGESKAAFEKAQPELATRIAHEVRVLTDGIVTG